MTDKLRAAAQQALDAIRSTEAYKYGSVMMNEAAEDLASALAEQPAEPVAWLWELTGEVTTDPDRADGMWLSLYTTPPQRKQPMTEEQSLPDAMETVIAAMQSDPDYAWSWHCNVAMAFVDAGGDHYTANQGAARFMKLLANVEPAHDLPEAPQPAKREPLTDDEIIRAASSTQSAEPGRDGYILPVTFARAVIAAYEAAHSITGGAK